ncbi:MAG: hypothetical protein H6629_14925 [Calditrichae bacterium]|nr:hypothetical protein [Calditrichia bacterium]
MMHRLVFLVAFGWIIFSVQQINAQSLIDKLHLPPHWHEKYEVVSEAGGVLTWRDRETKAVFKYLVDETVPTPKAFGFADTLWAEKPLQSTPLILTQPFMQTVLSGWAKRH